MQTVLTIGKALSDSNRVRTLMALKTHGELCACKISEFLNITSATVSRHMDVLIVAGLVESRKDGRWVFYRLSNRCAGESPVTVILNQVFLALANDPTIDADRLCLQEITRCDSVDLCKGTVEITTKHHQGDEE